MTPCPQCPINKTCPRYHYYNMIWINMIRSDAQHFHCSRNESLGYIIKWPGLNDYIEMKMLAAPKCTFTFDYVI